jgi:RNA polymerase sigma factor (sigma-70 family)
MIPNYDNRFYEPINDDILSIKFIMERKLNERERAIIYLRIEDQTYESIGTTFGITKERVRQIFYKAIMKIRKTISKENNRIKRNFGI